MNILSVNPATEEVIAQFAPHSEAQVNQLLDQAQRAFLQWRTVPLGERSALLQRVANYLRTNKASLALLATREMGKGYFYAPTIVTAVTPEMPMFREETFGPAAAIIRAEDAGHALVLANTSDFGLSSNLWTRGIAYACELASRIEAGGVFINGWITTQYQLFLLDLL